jgi:crotonobetainyl-CoA:carnitine CoA-transferase CaiB-like acyl-CoA transferase
MLLADAGAEVIKIERPKYGDPRRSMPPFVEKDGVKKAAGYMSYNRNKKSLALDLSKPEGQTVFKDLAKTADVVVENLRPGAMKKVGLSYEQLKETNPKLIWALISGFGQLEGYRGPYADRPAFDIVAEAMSGIMNLVGFEDKPPSWTIYGMADIYTGMVTSFGIMQALFMRERTGHGQLVDSAMFDNMLSLNESMVTLFSTAGQSPKRGVPKNLFPRGAFKTKDGYIALNVPDNRIWERLCEVIGREDLKEDHRCKSGTERAANATFIQPIIENWLATLTRDDAVDTLNEIGVPTGPVYTAEDVFADPQVKARGMLMPIDDPDIGEYAFTRSPIHLSDAPELPKNAAPNLGGDTEWVLRDILGYNKTRINALVDSETVEIG